MPKSNDPRRNANEWTRDEHAKYLESLERFPNGPWKVRAAFIGTRTTRQVMTHYQKINLRLKRHARGLLPAGRPRGACGKQRQERSVAPQEASTASLVGREDSDSRSDGALVCDANAAVSLPQSPLSPAAAAIALDANLVGEFVFDRIPWELMEWDAFALVAE